MRFSVCLPVCLVVRRDDGGVEGIAQVTSKHRAGRRGVEAGAARGAVGREADLGWRYEPLLSHVLSQAKLGTKGELQLRVGLTFNMQGGCKRVRVFEPSLRGKESNEQ